MVTSKIPSAFFTIAIPMFDHPFIEPTRFSVSPAYSARNVTVPSSFIPGVSSFRIVTVFLTICSALDFLSTMTCTFLASAPCGSVSAERMPSSFMEAAVVALPPSAVTDQFISPAGMASFSVPLSIPL